MKKNEDKTNINSLEEIKLSGSIIKRMTNNFNDNESLVKINDKIQKEIVNEAFLPVSRLFIHQFHFIRKITTKI